VSQKPRPDQVPAWTPKDEVNLARRVRARQLADAATQPGREMSRRTPPLPDPPAQVETPPELIDLVTACRRCGRPCPQRGPRGGRPAIYCSTVCRKRAYHGVGEPPACSRCGTPTRRGRKPGGRAFCSRPCRIAGGNEKQLARNEAIRRARGSIECAWCHRSVPKRQPRQRFCSKACYTRSTDRLSNARRVGLPEIRIVVRREVYDRDGWRCHLCRRPVNRRLRYPDPRSTSLDHLIPLADGGTHDPANLATAHLGCNQARSRGGTVQLRALA
jgi:hypothetical protein